MGKVGMVGINYDTFLSGSPSSITMFYFLLKAVVYFWIGSNYSIEQGLFIRTLFGSGSFYALLAISIFGSSKIFHFLKKLGVLGKTTLG